MLRSCSGFDWDEGNSDKNWLRHKVSRSECEQFFFNEPMIVNHDEKHSLKEKRWYALGRTDSQRFLFIVFTIRAELIRIISARDMSKKERQIYHEQAKRNSSV
jgi:uncharacterized protein